MKTAHTALLAATASISMLTATGVAHGAVEAPAISGSTPTSPSSSNSPRIRGSAPLGSIVTLYRSADCSGPIEARGGSLEFGWTGLQAEVPDNTTTVFTATATSTTNEVSRCSAPYEYREVSLVPPPATQQAAKRPKCRRAKRTSSPSEASVSRKKCRGRKR
jgi:hypothetical protein